MKPVLLKDPCSINSVNDEIGVAVKYLEASRVLSLNANTSLLILVEICAFSSHLKTNLSQGSRRLRFPEFLYNRHIKMTMLSYRAPAVLTFPSPGDAPGTHFC